jgi:type IX secretion system PorP/SprF family membrane protein
MKQMENKILKLLFLMMTSVMFAQQDAQFTHYMYNTISVNPAYAGSRETLSVFGLYRTQWVGFDGAPVTNSFSVNSPVGRRVGLGLSLVSDKIGPADEKTMSIDFSYTVNTSDIFKLSFGLKATANLLNIDFNKVSKHDLNDYAFDNPIDNQFTPNIGAGIYLHSDNTYFGLSTPNLVETYHFDRKAPLNANTHVMKDKLHTYFIAGHVFDVNESIKFKPAILTKMVPGAPLQVDLSGNFLINEKFMAGVAYRWSAAMSALVGFQINESWFIGYSYDLETTRLQNYNGGSHEIFLRYELFNNYDKIISPRFF